MLAFDPEEDHANARKRMERAVYTLTLSIPDDGPVIMIVFFFFRLELLGGEKQHNSIVFIALYHS
jgi:hypothetical protein